VTIGTIARRRAARARSGYAGAPLTALSLALTLALAATLAGCGGSSSALDDSKRPTASDLPPGLPRDAALLLEPYDDATHVAQLGTADITVSWSRIDDGRAEPTAGPDGTPALDMPDFTTETPYPRAALVVRNATDTDDLSPGTQDFTWGADFQLDAVSTAATGHDNGDNLLQRGLWGQGAEYKAEVDLRRASCVVHGTEGTLLVRAEMDAEPGKWYRMRCSRDSEGLTVTARELGSDGWGPEIEARVTGPVGSVDYPASTPVSIGGKVTPDGTLVQSATDQFNGLIANPVIQIGTAS
jgi:hypothetical protein